MEAPVLIDIIRGGHLLFMALGMGPALFYDVRSLHRIRKPISQSDLDELHRIHSVVSIACVGLWLSGAALIWVLTRFDFSEFSPKLWSKVAVVSILTVNATTLKVAIIPTLARFKGLRLVDIPMSHLVPMTLSAGVSLSCWMLALALGSSSVLKTANWDMLLPILLGGSAACICGVMAVALGMRCALRSNGAKTVSINS